MIFDFLIKTETKTKLSSKELAKHVSVLYSHLGIYQVTLYSFRTKKKMHVTTGKKPLRIPIVQFLLVTYTFETVIIIQFKTQNIIIILYNQVNLVKTG